MQNAPVMQAAKRIEWKCDDLDDRAPDRRPRPSERPTIPVPIPVPRDSGIRLAVTRIECGGATVDAVVCDLTRDPRSEDFAPERTLRPSQAPLRIFDWDTFTFVDEPAADDVDLADAVPHQSLIRALR